MAGAVSSCGTAVSLAALAKLQALAAKGSLIDLALWCTREGQAKRLQLEDDLIISADNRLATNRALLNST